MQFSLDSTDDGVNFEQPLYVQIQKNQPQYSYPLTFMQTFPFNAYEQTVQTSTFACKDNFSDAYPTCGWKLDSL